MGVCDGVGSWQQRSEVKYQALLLSSHLSFTQVPGTQVQVVNLCSTHLPVVTPYGPQGDIKKFKSQRDGYLSNKAISQV